MALELLALLLPAVPVDLALAVVLVAAAVADEALVEEEEPPLTLAALSVPQRSMMLVLQAV